MRCISDREESKLRKILAGMKDIAMILVNDSYTGSVLKLEEDELVVYTNKVKQCTLDTYLEKFVGVDSVTNYFATTDKELSDIKDLYELSEYKVDAVYEFNGVNFTSKWKVVFDTLASKPTNNENTGTQFEIDGKRIILDKCSMSKYKGRTWLSVLKNEYVNINARDNLILTSFYLTNSRKRADRNSDRMILEYLDDYVPMFMKFNGVRHFLLELQDKFEIINETTILEDYIQLENLTVNSGKIRDNNQGYTIYAPKGNVCEAFKFYPENWTGDLYRVYMGVILFNLLGEPFADPKKTYYMFVSREGRLQFGTPYSESQMKDQIAMGNALASDFQKVSIIKQRLREGLRKALRRMDADSSKFAELLDSVESRLVRVEVTDLYKEGV